MYLWTDVGKLSCLVGGGLHVFVMYSVLSITMRATPLSAITMMQSLSFLTFSSAKCSDLMMVACIGLLVKVLRILPTSW